MKNSILKSADLKYSIHPVGQLSFEEVLKAMFLQSLKFGYSLKDYLVAPGGLELDILLTKFETLNARFTAEVLKESFSFQHQNNYSDSAGHLVELQKLHKINMGTIKGTINMELFRQGKIELSFCVTAGAIPGPLMIGEKNGASVVS